MQYQLLILRTHRHFTSQVWLGYDQAFWEHVAATQLTDWSCMNMQLFNFHAAGLSARSSTSSHPPDWEPTGSSGSLVVCISWNICHYAHCIILPSLHPVSVVSPLKVEEFARELAGHPDQSAVYYVIGGLRHGFQLGFHPTLRLKSAKSDKPAARLTCR